MAGKSDVKQEKAPDTVTREEAQKMVQDAAAASAKAAVEALMPAMAAAAKMNQPAVQAGNVRRERKHIQKCGICKQALTGCESKHTEMVVYPTRYPEFGDWFQGVFINGARYLSDGPHHKIPVPTNTVGTISSIIQTWEDNERSIRIGRKKAHNSGVIGDGGGATRSAQAGWR